MSREEDYLIQQFNDGTMFRVTHRESGIHRTGHMYSGESGNIQIAHMMDEIEDELRSQSIAAVGFADALKAVIEDDKGMVLDPESVGLPVDAEPSFVIRAQQPDETSMMTIPYLYIEMKDNGVTSPWTPDQPTMFAWWRIID